MLRADSGAGPWPKAGVRVARVRPQDARRGSVETGAWSEYPPDPTRRDLEMVRPLSP